MDYVLKISKLLKEKRITKREFAEQIGKNENTVANYLNGRTKIDVDTLIKIANVLNVPICYFFEKDYIDIKFFSVLKTLISYETTYFEGVIRGIYNISHDLYIKENLTLNSLRKSIDKDIRMLKFKFLDDIDLKQLLDNKYISKEFFSLIKLSKKKIK